VPLLRLTGTTYAGAPAIPWLVLAGVAAIVSTLLLEEPLRRAWRLRERPGRQPAAGRGHRPITTSSAADLLQLPSGSAVGPAAPENCPVPTVSASQFATTLRLRG
jgi:hypothetical protein